MTRRRRLFQVVIPAVMLVGASYTAGAQTARPRTYASAQQRPPEQPLPPPPTADQLAIAESVSQTIAQVASEVSPSVVRIVVRTGGTQPRARARRGKNPFEGTPFERFFDGRRPEEQETHVAMGSGVVIDPRGYILTNNHVVEQAREVKVTFVGGAVASASVVGTDPKSDLAVIKVDGVHVVPARFGDSDRMKAGETVIAIGNPFGLDHSVTVGVLSAKGRAGFESGQYEDFLQTDASINPGNSGGPLVNLQGEVVGINTMIVGLGTGVGFAVASTMAQPIARQLIEHGRVVRPYVGIAMQSMTPELARTLGRNAPAQGAIVSEVQPDSPAARAGLQPGDIIVAVDGQRMEGSHDVQRAVLMKAVGAPVTFTVWRDGREARVTMKTVELPAAETQKPAAAKAPTEHERLGIELQTLSPSIAQRLGLDPTLRGALVAAVREGSLAAEAGLKPGDVIVQIDGKAIADAESAARALVEKRAQGHLVRVRREQGALFLVVPSA